MPSGKLNITPTGFVQQLSKHIDLSNKANWDNFIASLPHRQRIQVAATLLVRVDLLYRKKTEADREVHRRVEPYEFRIEKGTLYLFAHCMTHEETHKFIVARIEDCAILLGSKYTPRWQVKIPAMTF